MRHVDYAKELNGPLTALFIYIDEINKQARMVARTGDDYLLQLSINARAQAERALAIVMPTSIQHTPLVLRRKNKCSPHRVVLANADEKPSLTKREREAMNLIVAGCSNKEGAHRMKIGTRTFESHRAEVMRKLSARNAADLVRARLNLEMDEEVRRLPFDRAMTIVSLK